MTLSSFPEQKSARLRLLVVYPYVPFPVDRGTYQRTFNLLKELAKYHSVDFFALCEEPDRLKELPRFQAFCNRVKFHTFNHKPWPKFLSPHLFKKCPRSVSRWHTLEAQQALLDFQQDKTYDFIYVCDLAMAQYFLNRPLTAPLILDRSRVDLQYQLACMQRGDLPFTNWENVFKMKAYERKAGKTACLEIVGGEDDEIFIKTQISNQINVLTLPNGFDDEMFQLNLTAEKADEPTILFCGAMDYVPNIDALRWFFSEIHPKLLSRIPKLKCLIVGKAPIPEVMAYSKLAGVTVTGEVPAVQPFYQQAWLQVVPLRIGGGSRLKIPECLATGTPVISTTIGAQGLGLVHEHHILLADTTEEFVEATVSAIYNPVLRNRLSEAGAREVKNRLTWTKLGKTLSDKLLQLHDHQLGYVSPTAGGIVDQKPLIPALGVPFDRITLNGALNRIEQMVASKMPHQVVTANVDFAAQASKDPELRQIFANAHLVVCDGMPLIWVSKLCGNPLPQRVTGSDMVPLLLERAAQKGWSVFFLGQTPEMLAKAMQAAPQKYPGLKLVGGISPPFISLAKLDNKSICNTIYKAKPDILFVAMGCPKQEKWISQNLHSLGVPVCIGVGASLDFLAGKVLRAPKWMQRSGLEWLFRLLQEPKRLFLRYAGDFKLLILTGCKQRRYRYRKNAPSSPTNLSSLRLPPHLTAQTISTAGDQFEKLALLSQDAFLDASRVETMDTTALGVLLRLHRNLTVQGYKLILKNPSIALQEALKQCGFEQVIETKNL